MKQLILLAALSVPAMANAAEVRFTGTAKAVDSGDTLYQETHRVSGSCEAGRFTPENHEVDYSRQGDEPFASKALSYSQSILRPTVNFRQPDFSEVIEITNRDDSALEITWQSPSGSKEVAKLDIEPELVADSGFDNFVRQNWTQVIENGEAIEFKMVAPTRGDYYGFTLEPAEDSRIDADHLVRIRPTSTLMRFLVDPILLGYNDDGLLTDYLGLTNIRKNEDSNHTAHIRYNIETTPDCELTR